VLQTNDKPAFDEQTLAKLLEAAYVVQEHNHALQTLAQRTEYKDRPAQQAQPIPAPVIGQPETSQPVPAVKDDYALSLAKIVETQHEIEVRHLELEGAITLVAERVTEIAEAGGAAIGIVDGKSVRYKAAVGAMTLPAGAEVPLEKALSLECLRTGQVLRCANVSADFLLDADDCRRRGIQALIAAPVYGDHGIAGSLELYYASQEAFSEQDVHTCQLMRVS